MIIKDKSIYPNVKIEDNGYKMLIESFLRKKHSDGKWYLVHFREIINLLKCPKLEKHFYVDRFHTYVYMFLIRGSITPDAQYSHIDMPEDYVHKLDDNQEDEAGRMTRHIRQYKG